MIDAFLDWLEDQRTATRRLSNSLVAQLVASPTMRAASIGVICLLLAVMWYLGAAFAPQLKPQIELRSVLVVVTPTAAASPQFVSLRPTEAAVDPRPKLATNTIAYSAPDNASAFNTLAAGTHYAIVERSGPSWLRVDVGSVGAPNLIWLKVDALIGASSEVPDIATATPAPVPAREVVVAYQLPQAVTEQPAPVEQPAPSAPPASPDGQWINGSFYPTRYDANGQPVDERVSTGGPTYDANGRQIGVTPPPGPITWEQRNDGTTTTNVAVVAEGDKRLCTGFGDWRDYHEAYTSSPICHRQPEVAQK